MSVLDVIETELAYPGLHHAIDLEIWQRELIEKQVKSETSENADG